MIIIRVDANRKIGMGHVMRCLSIADAFKDLGTDVCFVTAGDEVAEFLKTRGYRDIVLSTDYRDMEAERETLFHLKEFDDSDMMIVDSYFATDDYLSALREKKPTAYIDDLCKARPVSAIVNYNIFACEGPYKNGASGETAKLLLGPRFAPLREMFREGKKIDVKEEARNVLFLSGGSDPEHVALNFAKEIKKHKDGFNYTVLLGMLSGDYDELKEIADASDGRIEAVRNVSAMDELILNTDIAISAAGSTLYELCSMGVPTITYITADNQEPAAAAFADKEIMIYGGDARKDAGFYEGLYKKTVTLLKDIDARKVLSDKALTCTDGRGAERIAERLGDLFM